ncbi:2-dehydropantoate 2-reductase [Sandaracinobacteroides sp. A072]|uniref:2-dehydropantoate 2-reductase n=1 Tax=Sandaracinobacteroides sp. A072 TaxID=3461146 RepID=UPI00404338CA
MAGERTKIAVFGAGLIGIYLGGLLARSADVTLIGREAMLAPLADGLRVTDAEGMDVSVPASALTCTPSPEGLAGADLVLVTVKSMATPEAAAAIARHAPADALIISLQNGVSNADVLRSALPAHRVLAGMVPFNVAQRGPAHFHRGTGGGLVVEDSAVLAPFEPLFEATGVPIAKSSDIVSIQWGKLLINLNNAINALSGISLANELRQRDYRRVWAMQMEEGLKLLKAAGIEPADAIAIPVKLMPQILRLPDRLYRYVSALSGGGKVRVDPHARSSMADDLARGRITEIDYLQGELVRLAQRLNRKAPANARMVELVRAAEKGATPWAAADLYRDLRDAVRAS